MTLQASFDRIEAALGELDTALAGQDAGAIIAASSLLATAVSELRAMAPRGRDLVAATALIEVTLRRLESAAMKVNLLANWNRQRIDALTALRSNAGNSASLTY